MIDGVSWAAGEIVGFMILATLVGLAIGWILGRWLQRSVIADGYEAELNAQRELARKAEHRLVESNAALDRLQEQLRAESEKVGELEAQLGASQQTVSDLAVELSATGGSGEAIGRAKADLATARAELEKRRVDIKRLQLRLDTSEKVVGDLETRLGETETEAARAADLERQLVAAQKDLDSARGSGKVVEGLEADLEEAAAAKSQLSERLSVAEDRLAAMEHLPGELAAAQAELESSRVTIADLEAQLRDRPAAELTKDAARKRIDEVAVRTAAGEPPRDDDLKKIHGVGPKIEGMLKEMGITSFRQIANFTEEDIVVVTAALDAFKGRIERDDWMSSAAEQHAQKYGEPV